MKKDMKKLRQERADKQKRGLVAVEKLNGLLAKDTLSDAEQADLTALETEVEQLEADITAIDKDIEAEEKKIRRAKLFSASSLSTPRISVNDPNPETTAGFKSLAEFAGAVFRQSVSGLRDARLDAMMGAASGYHQNQGAGGEGILVPTDFRAQIWELVFSAGDLLTLVDNQPTASNAVQITKDETTPWGGSGVQAYWRAEAAQMQATRSKFSPTLLQLHELYSFVLATDELISDAPLLENRLTRKAADAIRFAASDAIAWGDGSGKPLGFMNSGAKVSVAAESGQTAGTINAANVGKMLARLLPQNLSNAFWMANSEVIPQLMQMTIGTQPVWTPPSQGFADAPGGFLLGRPILLTEHAEALGTEGDLVLVDGMGYAMATKAGGGIDFASSIHLYFDQGVSAFRWTFRMGGQPYLSAPISPKRGSATKSHFVSLAAR